MRQFTHYEITVLIKNEINNMTRDARSGGLDINYVQERAKDILEYIEMFKSLGEDL